MTQIEWKEEGNVDFPLENSLQLICNKIMMLVRVIVLVLGVGFISIVIYCKIILKIVMLITIGTSL